MITHEVLSISSVFTSFIIFLIESISFTLAFFLVFNYPLSSFLPQGLILAASPSWSIPRIMQIPARFFSQRLSVSKSLSLLHYFQLVTYQYLKGSYLFILSVFLKYNTSFLQQGLLKICLCTSKYQNLHGKWK